MCILYSIQCILITCSAERGRGKAGGRGRCIIERFCRSFNTSQRALLAQWHFMSLVLSVVWCLIPMFTSQHIDFPIVPASISIW